MKNLRSKIEDVISESNQSHRGLGMAEMKKFISGIVEGELVIMSKKGGYWYNGKNHTEKISDFSHPVPGTIVAWWVPITALDN